MRFNTLILAFLLLGVTAQAADLDLRAVVSARELLPAAAWSRLVEIDNKNNSSAYPKKVYALIFEFAGILWFYTPTDGTQSFSRYVNRAEEEKSNLRPGLVEIDPGFTSYREVEPDQFVYPVKELPNGCFVQSVAAGWEQLNDPAGALRARLVMFYSKQREAGHCILAYETADGVFCLDPTDRRIKKRVGSVWPKDEAVLALAAWPGGSRSLLQRVRTVEFPVTLAPRMQQTFAAARAAAQSAAA